MKKRFLSRAVSALCASAMLMSGVSVMPASAEVAEVTAPRIMGDVTGDCRVTIEDAKRTLDAFVAGQIGLREETLTEDIAPADINMNGTLELLDALAIMRYFCRTLVGDQPLWSEIRKLTYHDGTEYDPGYFNREPDENEGEAVHAPFELRGMYLEIGCAEGKPGEVVEIPVYLAGIKQFTCFGYSQFAPNPAKLVGVSSPICGAEATVTYNEQTGKCENPVMSGFSEDGTKMWSVAASDTHIGFGFNSLNDQTLDPKDGTVLATFKYEIPKDAKEGDHYVITLDTKTTTFHLGVEGENDQYQLPQYQYTLLDGVIVVK